ncbi:MAG: peptidase M14 [Kutzneria sp.]|nr:peptidase M14 [Kutzneria sp.]MBV9843813.1 peptidase M14 [Kutzneria sp.]
MAPRSLLPLALGVTALLLPAAMFTSAASAAPAGDPPILWRVPVTAGQPAQLLAAGFDVAEATDDGAVDVVGGQATADALRRLGYQPVKRDTVYKDVARSAPAADTYYGGYRTVPAQLAHLTDVASAHPDLATTYDIGDSWLKTKGKGGHDIEAICLTKKQAGDCSLSTTSHKPKFTLMAQIHAREISTGELALRWIDYLVNGYATDPQAKAILDNTEVWVIPIANPDGVDVVASGGNSPRMQRKNVDDTNGGGCVGTDTGIDLNRNSTYKWGGDSNAPCDETFQGPTVASEPEVKGLEGFFRSIYPVQRGTGDNDPAPVTAKGTMITLHSYGNDIIVPWGYTNKPSPNDAALRALGKKLAASNGYVVDNNGGTVGYLTSGTTDDFTYGVLGVASFTIEVGPDAGNCGGFFPQFSCLDSTFWPQMKGAFTAAANAAGAPYQQ